MSNDISELNDKIVALLHKVGEAGPGDVDVPGAETLLLELKSALRSHAVNESIHALPKCPTLLLRLARRVEVITSATASTLLVDCLLYFTETAKDGPQDPVAAKACEWALSLLESLACDDRADVDNGDDVLGATSADALYSAELAVLRGAILGKLAAPGARGAAMAAYDLRRCADMVLEMLHERPLGVELAEGVLLRACRHPDPREGLNSLLGRRFLDRVLPLVSGAVQAEVIVADADTFEAVVDRWCKEPTQLSGPLFQACSQHVHLFWTGKARILHQAGTNEDDRNKLLLLFTDAVAAAADSVPAHGLAHPSHILDLKVFSHSIHPTAEPNNPRGMST